MDEVLYSISESRMTQIADETRRITGMTSSMNPANIVRALSNYAIGSGGGGSSGGGGGGNTGRIYTLDLTSIFTVNSSSTDNFSAFIADLDGESILNADKVIIKYYDEAYSGEIMSAEITSWQIDPNFDGSGIEARLYAAFNGDNGQVGGFRLRIIKNDATYAGHISYWPDIGASSSIVTKDGYTEIKGLRRPVAIDFSGDLCTIVLEGNQNRLVQFNRDDSGKIVSMTLDNEHVIEITGGLTGG